MSIIASYSIKGGVGKTALSVNLVYALHQAGKRTLLVDLDPQCAAAFYFRVQPARKVRLKKNMSGLAGRLERNIRESDFPGIDILPSNLAYRNFDIALDRMKRSRRRLADLLGPLEAAYDYIIIDSPPNITLLSENIFRVADTVLVPVIPTTLSQRTLEQLFAFFEKKKLATHSIVPFFSMVQKRNRLHRDTMTELRDHYPAMLDTTIPFSVDIERMGIHRQPALAYVPPRSRANAYRQLCEEIMLPGKKTNHAC